MVTTVAFVGVIIVFLGLALTAYAVYLTEGCGSRKEPSTAQFEESNS
jgi:uncharacterized membrane protein